jgi:hypothetical protein
MPEYINGVPLVWDTAGDERLLGGLLGNGPGGQALRSILSSTMGSSPLLEQEWGTYALDDFSAKFFDASKAMEQGSRLKLFLGGPEGQPTDPGTPYSIKDIILGEGHFVKQGELFGYRNKDKVYEYTEGVDELLGKHLDMYLFFSTDGAWLLETATKLNQIGDNELAVFLEISPPGSIDWLSETVLVAKGGKNAAEYYNQPKLADWFGHHCTLDEKKLAELVRACHDADSVQAVLRDVLSDLGTLVAWLPKKVGELFCWVGEKLEGLRIEKSTWDRDWVASLIQYFEELEKSISEKTMEWVKDGVPLLGIHIPLPESLQPTVLQIGRFLMGICKAIREFLQEIGSMLTFLFALVCGVINGIIDMVAAIFIFVGWILKLIGGGIEGVADAAANADYYKAMLMEYADNLLQAIQKINWKEVLQNVVDWMKRIYDGIDLSAMFSNVSVSGRELGYYIGYVGINIVGCFVGLGEIAAITRIGKAEGILKTLMEWVSNAVGKLPVAAKLTAEGIFAVIKAYVGLLAKGTRSVIEFINKVFAAILQWVLMASGKVAREVYLLTLSGGRRLACSLIPIESLAILLGRIISEPVRRKLNNFNIRFFEKEGVFYARYNDQVIFEGDRAAASRFIDDIEAREGDDIKRMLDDLTKKKRVPLQISKKAEQRLQEHVDNALSKWKNPSERPGAASVLEGIVNGKVIFVVSYTAKGMSKDMIDGKLHRLVKEWLDDIAPEVLRRRVTHGKCAENFTISDWLYQAESILNIKKGSMKIEQARALLKGAMAKTKSIDNVGEPLLQGLNKAACPSCNGLLSHFNITEIFK